jgi:hypothetical protein
MTGLPGFPGDGQGPGGPRCSELSREAGEPLAGTAPRADVWVAVEHTPGWGDADLTRSAHGVRVLMARGRRTTPAGGAASAPAAGSTSGPTFASGAVDPASPPYGAGVRVWVAYATPTPALRVGLVDRPDVVAGWDLADIASGSLRGWGCRDPDPLLLVCANGRRDRCCGHSGGRLADALWRGPHADRVLTCTHLGGHRFAPTALLLPVGALHGRLDEQRAARLLTDASVARMGADTLRGHSTLDQPAQVAEIHARAVTGHKGLAPLQVELTASDDPDRIGATVRGWDPHDEHQSLEFDLVRTSGQALLSCGRAPEATTRWSIPT